MCTASTDLRGCSDRLLENQIRRLSRLIYLILSRESGGGFTYLRWHARTPTFPVPKFLQVQALLIWSIRVE